MPKLYEYLGIIIFFYSNEHEPVHVHVHARSQGCESKIELVIDDGKIIKIIVLDVKGKKPLPTKQLKNFEELVSKLSDEIVQHWVNYFVYHKKIVPKKIEGKL